ncbi:MAG: MinD/ParA family protein [bacterium]
MADQAMRLRELAAASYASTRAQIVTISSGKGGVGKTNLAVNLSIALAQIGKSVIVVDADLGLANIDVIMGSTPKYNLYHVLKGQKSIKDIIIPGPKGIRVIAGGSGIVELANLSEEQRLKLINSLSEIENSCDYILVDTSAGITQNVINFILAADESIIVTTPDPAAITDAYGVINAVSSKKRDDPRLKLIVNRVRSVQEGRNVAEKIKAVAKQFLNVYVENMGIIFEDPLVYEAVRRRQPFILAYPNCKASLCLNDLAAKMVNESYLPGSRTADRGSFFRRVMKFFMVPQ